MTEMFMPVPSAGQVKRLIYPGCQVHIWMGTEWLCGLLLLLFWQFSAFIECVFHCTYPI